VEPTHDAINVFYAATAFVIASAALVTGLGVLAKSRFGGAIRWVFRHLVGDPVSKRARTEVTEVVRAEMAVMLTPIFHLLEQVQHEVAVVQHEVMTNNGSSMRDEVRDIRSTLTSFMGSSILDRTEVRGMVQELLDHDAQRDVEGRRYGAAYVASVDSEPPQEES
jgi:hypothetical protein